MSGVIYCASDNSHVVQIVDSTGDLLPTDKTHESFEILNTVK